jgi:ABC-type uncharacterized transport system YnjBCD ATPase subunit
VAQQRRNCKHLLAFDDAEQGLLERHPPCPELGDDALGGDRVAIALMHGTCESRACVLRNMLGNLSGQLVATFGKLDRQRLGDDRGQLVDRALRQVGALHQDALQGAVVMCTADELVHAGLGECGAVIRGNGAQHLATATIDQHIGDGLRQLRAARYGVKMGVGGLACDLD